MARLIGKTAAVTGSSSGNGRAIALALAAEGANVVCSDIRKNALDGGYEDNLGQDTDDIIRANGGKAEYLDADAGKRDDVQAVVDRAVQAFGRLDIMVNNAGIFTGLHTIVDETEEEFDKTMLVNCKSVWLGCKSAITQMRRQDVVDGTRGRIVNIASIGGLVGLAMEPAYCTAKGAVVNLTRQLAVDFSPERININAVCPGFLHTAMVRPFIDDPELNEVLHSKTPWPDLGYAEDVAKATTFLASADASWASGSMLTIDGGYTAP
ncbi:SDR family oxidoreductase [Pseudonocardia sp. C8]|uniref:SDR family NAD(P)-dependent oxidoreductase n=1 Tax=Pseudonocardia sp. C8 TaxID=2762759 RepID=UPI0016428732|nr:SDR family oxidoreductase [Pseudonocardia sp. C8]MBC3193109.1 SDR family oxidoreductase [Pseudonocardia sp. C8]